MSGPNIRQTDMRGLSRHARRVGTKEPAPVRLGALYRDIDAGWRYFWSRKNRAHLPVPEVTRNFQMTGSFF